MDTDADTDRTDSTGPRRDTRPPRLKAVCCGARMSWILPTPLLLFGGAVAMTLRVPPGSRRAPADLAPASTRRDLRHYA
jgi:hypothetical protein